MTAQIRSMQIPEKRLRELIKENTIAQIAGRFGVSSNKINSAMKAYGIETPRSLKNVSNDSNRDKTRPKEEGANNP
jgi:hypothetical protein